MATFQATVKMQKWYLQYIRREKKEKKKLSFSFSLSVRHFTRKPDQNTHNKEQNKTHNQDRTDLPNSKRIFPHFSASTVKKEHYFIPLNPSNTVSCHC